MDVKRYELLKSLPLKQLKRLGEMDEMQKIMISNCIDQYFLVLGPLEKKIKWKLLDDA